MVGDLCVSGSRQVVDGDRYLQTFQPNRTSLDDPETDNDNRR